MKIFNNFNKFLTKDIYKKVQVEFPKTAVMQWWHLLFSTNVTKKPSYFVASLADIKANGRFCQISVGILENLNFNAAENLEDTHLSILKKRTVVYFNGKIKGMNRTVNTHLRRYLEHVSGFIRWSPLNSHTVHKYLCT